VRHLAKFVKIGRATLIHWLGWVQHLLGPVGFGCEKLTHAHLWGMYRLIKPALFQPLLDTALLCGSGWTRDNGNCYYASEDQRTQASARSKCQHSDADLVSIIDENEKKFVAGLL